MVISFLCCKLALGCSPQDGPIRGKLKQEGYNTKTVHKASGQESIQIQTKILADSKQEGIQDQDKVLAGGKHGNSQVQAGVLIGSKHESNQVQALSLGRWQA